MLFNVKTRKLSNDPNKPNTTRNDILEVESKEKAIEFIKREYPNWEIDQIRDVTNCKKYKRGIN